MTTDTPTSDERQQFSLRALTGVEAGLGQADPTAEIARKLETDHPGHLVLVQAGKFLHGFDRTAYVLNTLKSYQLKLVGTAEAPHLRVGFPASNFKRRLWPMVAEFGIPYVVAIGTQASGHTVYASGQGDSSVINAVSPDIIRELILELRQRGELNKAAARQLLTSQDTAGFKLKSQAQDIDNQILLDIIKMPRDRLKARVLRYIGDHDIRQLLTSLIDSWRTDNRFDDLFHSDSAYRCTEAKGIPIGNLSSQLFANIYLSDFDHWVKEQLRLRYFIRYVDDMVCLFESREEAQTTCARITERLSADGLTVHPRKIRIAPASAGIPFLGYVVWPNHVSAGRYLRRRYLQRLRQHETGGYDRSESLESYRAMFGHTGATR